MTKSRFLTILALAAGLLAVVVLFCACGVPAKQAGAETAHAQAAHRRDFAVGTAQEAEQQPTAEPTATPLPQPTPFSVAWMTDTQEYTANQNEVFCAMTQWIADTQSERNTLLTVHTGDLIRGSYREYEWENMEQAFSLLPDDMMIVTVGGNHDIASYTEDYTPYLWYRPDTDVREENTFADGFVYYTTFEAGGVPFLVISVTYGYEIEAEDWINAVCAQNAGRYAILCVHGYLDNLGFSSGGRYLFPGVVQKSPNIRLVLCGHEHGANYKPDEIDDDGDGVPDRTVQQMLFNLQADGETGLGYLRMLRFDTVNDTIGVYTYSPFLDVEGYCAPDGFPVGDGFGANHTITDAGLAEFRIDAAEQH
ncbi:MAG TPA: metallophosphoesterase [Eubacteriales bacterium]|nr:metallophosphoesterase [Eubacteriales bacterium]